MPKFKRNLRLRLIANQRSNWLKNLVEKMLLAAKRQLIPKELLKKQTMNVNERFVFNFTKKETFEPLYFYQFPPLILL